MQLLKQVHRPTKHRIKSVDGSNRVAKWAETIEFDCRDPRLSARKASIELLKCWEWRVAAFATSRKS